MLDVRAHLIRALLDDAGAAAGLAHATSRPWASVTFVGERHCIALILPAVAADRIACELAEREFAIPGHLVADIAVVSRDDAGSTVRLGIEALTIEER